MLDLVIENGSVADGAGKPARAADVGVRGDKIAAVGNLREARARERLDASGLVVSPGFIDIHTHSDFSLLSRGGAESQAMQGVTFEVVGNCGHSCAPIGEMEDPRKLTLGYEPSIKIDWATFNGYLSRLERAKLGVNVASFVGHCTLRHAVMRGEPRPATDGETEAMRRLLEESLEQGAVGFSTGLEYNPGKAARSEEVAELCKAAGRRGALYATHVRNRDLFYESGFGEALACARAAKARLQISHIVTKFGAPRHAMEHTMEMVDWSKREGLDVAFDMIPHNWSPTMVSAMLPVWAFEGGVKKLLKRLKSPKEREKMRHNPMPIWQLVPAGRWRDILIFNSPRNPGLGGMSLADIAKRRRKRDVTDMLFDLLLEEGDNLMNLTWIGRNFTEADNKTALMESDCVVISDGITVTGDDRTKIFSPSVCGWAARFLQRYVREMKLMTLEEGIRRLTGLPAARLGLKNRGTIAKGRFADITIFSYETLRDRSTVKNPGRHPVGIRHVLVNGKFAVRNGRRTEVNNGRVVRG